MAERTTLVPARFFKRTLAGEKFTIWVQHRRWLFFWKDHHHVENKLRQAKWDVITAWEDLLDALRRVQKYKNLLKEADQIIQDDVRRGRGIKSTTFDDEVTRGELAPQGELVDSSKEYKELIKAQNLENLLSDSSVQAIGGKHGRGNRAAIYPKGSKPPTVDLVFDESYAWNLEQNKGKGNQQRKSGQNRQNQNQNTDQQ